MAVLLFASQQRYLTQRHHHSSIMCIATQSQHVKCQDTERSIAQSSSLPEQDSGGEKRNPPDECPHRKGYNFLRVTFDPESSLGVLLPACSSFHPSPSSLSPPS